VDSLRKTILCSTEKAQLLVFAWNSANATSSNCGKPLRAFDTKVDKRKRQLAKSKNLDGKNSKDWAIRSQAPKVIKTDYGEGSTTR
jgi:hypothetical protein